MWKKNREREKRAPEGRPEEANGTAENERRSGPEGSYNGGEGVSEEEGRGGGEAAAKWRCERGGQNGQELIKSQRKVGELDGGSELGGLNNFSKF